MANFLLRMQDLEMAERRWSKELSCSIYLWHAHSILGSNDLVYNDIEKYMKNLLLAMDVLHFAADS